MVVSFFVFMLGGWGYLSLWHLLGAMSLLVTAATFALAVPMAYRTDRKRASDRRSSHPDENWYEFPLLNAIGFENGVPVLPGTKKAKKWLRNHRSLRTMSQREIEETSKA